MNKQSITFLLLAAAMMLLGTSQVFAQDTFFFTDFDYDVEPIPIAATDLNGANDQVGLWSGDDFPAADGSGFFTPDSGGFTDNPFGGRLLFIDRPIADATHFANLTDEIPITGARVSFSVGTRRTGGGGAKDYDLFGLDAAGNESFRVRIASGGPERLGYVSDEGATATFDLPTIVGEDGQDDLDNIGGPPFDASDPIGNITVSLGLNGYRIDFDNGNNSYSTSTLAYNGSATTLSQVGLFYQGVEGVTGSQSGFFIDTLHVTGFAELLPGDFDFNGLINTADFQILADNFAEGTTFEQGDFNFDGKVDLFDFAAFKQAFNAPGQAVAAVVPEPGSMTWMGMVGLGIFNLMRRKRLCVGR